MIWTGVPLESNSWKLQMIGSLKYYLEMALLHVILLHNREFTFVQTVVLNSFTSQYAYFVLRK